MLRDSRAGGATLFGYCQGGTMAAMDLVGSEDKELSSPWTPGTSARWPARSRRASSGPASATG